MKKFLLLFMTMFSLGYANQGVPEPEDLKNLRHGVRVEGCVAGLMYYTRDKEVSKPMREFCERVIRDAQFNYDFTKPQKIDPQKNKNFKRFEDEIKI